MSLCFLPNHTNRYGGPSSQLVDLTFGRDWHQYLVCRHQYIVVTVDGRGTGFKGRKLRNTVKGNLGYFETIDQINAAKCVLCPYLTPGLDDLALGIFPFPTTWTTV